MQKNSGFIKVGAVLSSLALASSFVWYQSRGKTRIMSGSKSSAASAAATSYVEAEDITRASYNADGELEIKPQANASSSTTTRTFTAEEEAAIRKELMYSSKSGIVFEPADAAQAKPFTIIPVPPPSQPAVSPPRRRTIMPGSKTLIIDDMPIELTPQSKPASEEKFRQQPQQQQSQQRRVLLPSSKSKAFTE